MRGDDYRDSSAQHLEFALDQLGTGSIEVRGRLVEQQQGGSGIDAQHCPGDRQAAQLAGAQLSGGSVGQAQAVHERVYVIAIERQFVAHRLADGSGMLWHISDARRVDAPQAAALGQQHSSQDLEQRCLTASARTLDEGGRTGRQGEVQVGNRANSDPVSPGGTRDNHPQRFRGINHFARATHGGETVLRGVERSPQGTEGREALRREY